MDLSKILSISGKPGLHKIIAQTKNGMVVESLAEKTRFTAFAHQRISSLEEISVYSYGDDVPLKEVLKKIYTHLEGGKAPDPKGDTKILGDFFEAAFPEYDQERVYLSDIKKIISWYNQLVELDMLDFSDEENETGEAESNIEVAPGEHSAEDPSEPAT